MDDELVTIAEIVMPFEMALARSYLESAGIEVFVGDEMTARVANHLTPMVGGYKLQVRSSDVELALELLEEAKTGSPEDLSTDSAG